MKLVEPHEEEEELDDGWTERQKLIKELMKPISRLIDADYYEDDDDDIEDFWNLYEYDAYVEDTKGEVIVVAKLSDSYLHVGIRLVADASQFYKRRFDIRHPNGIQLMYDELNYWIDLSMELNPKGHGEWYLRCIEWGKNEK